MFEKATTLAVAILLAMSLNPASAQAQDRIAQLALFGPTIQIFGAEEDIKGVRLNIIYGINRNVTGLDLGIVNRTSQNFKGIQFGFVGVSDGSGTGWQTNSINITRGQFVGLQTGFANIAGSGRGIQWAPAFNHTKDFRGLQVALVNYAENLHGVQVGLINIIKSKDRFPFLPLVNWKFD